MSIVLHSILIFIFTASFALGHIANSYRDSLLIVKSWSDLGQAFGWDTTRIRFDGVFRTFLSILFNGKVQFNDTMLRKMRKEQLLRDHICLFRSLLYVAYAILKCLST